MSTPHRDIIDALMTAIIIAVPELQSATRYVEEPVTHDPNGTHLAIWFEGDAVDEAKNTTMSITVDDLYGLRYWERAPDRPRKVVDEDAASDIEALLDKVRAVIMANPVNLGTSYYTRYAGSSKFIGRDSTAPKGGNVAGFEIAVRARRSMVFT